MTIEIRSDGGEAFLAYQQDHRKALVAPRDDMWAAFAAMAKPYAIIDEGKVVGCCAVNDERELHHFYLAPECEDRGESIFAYLVDRLDIANAVPSTVDPGFLSLALEKARNSVSVALMYQHVLEPRGPALTGLRVATEADHADAVAFAMSAIGAPEGFLKPYFAERIERAELLLHAEGGAILATGECRVDRAHVGYAHLGLIVGNDTRGRGVGSQLMNALVAECRHQDLQPLCSTEPGNLPARRLIHKAGFIARHRVFRVNFGPSGDGPSSGSKAG